MPTCAAWSLKPLLTLTSALTLTIKTYDEAIEKNAEEKYPEIKGLVQIFGVGPLTASAFVLTLDDASKFKASRRAINRRRAIRTWESAGKGICICEDCSSNAPS